MPLTTEALACPSGLSGLPVASGHLPHAVLGEEAIRLGLRDALSDENYSRSCRKP